MLQSSELLKKNLVELKGLLREYQGELYLLKFKASTGQLDTTHKIKLVRRDIARVQTIINQKLQGKEKPPKVVKSKTPKTVSRSENRIESETQTSENSDLLKESGFEASLKKEAKNSQTSQDFKEKKTEGVVLESKEEGEGNKELKKEGV